MRELTTAERHQVYQLVLEELNDYETSGYPLFLCARLKRICKKLFGFHGTPEMFPEFIAKKPANSNYVWFKRLPNEIFDYASRRELINKCIEETKS